MEFEGGRERRRGRGEGMNPEFELGLCFVLVFSSAA